MGKEKELNENYDKSYSYKKWKVNVKYNNTYSLQDYLKDVTEAALSQKIDQYKNSVINNL